MAELMGSRLDYPDHEFVLPAEKVAGLIDTYLRTSDAKPWSPLKSFDWENLDARGLPSAQRSAVAFVTYIEDHLPQYFQEIYRRYPLDASVDSQRFMHNRELYRFYVRWAQDEESHADVLFRYQVAAKITDAATLRADLAKVGPSRFDLPGQGAVAAITYAAVQEKATQLFYQQFARVAEEPVLKAVLRCMARDEARHYAFFSQLLALYLEHFGCQVLPAIENTVFGFRMPLSDVLTNYWRWSIAVAEAVGGYDHTQAYPALLAIIRGASDPSTRVRSRSIEQLVESLCHSSEEHEPC